MTGMSHGVKSIPLGLRHQHLYIINSAERNKTLRDQGTLRKYMNDKHLLLANLYIDTQVL